MLEVGIFIAWLVVFFIGFAAADDNGDAGAFTVLFFLFVFFLVLIVATIVTLVKYLI